MIPVMDFKLKRESVTFILVLTVTRLDEISHPVPRTKNT